MDADQPALLGSATSTSVDREPGAETSRNSNRNNQVASNDDTNSPSPRQEPTSAGASHSLPAASEQGSTSEGVAQSSVGPSRASTEAHLEHTERSLPSTSPGTEHPVRALPVTPGIEDLSFTNGLYCSGSTPIRKKRQPENTRAMVSKPGDIYRGRTVDHLPMDMGSHLRFGLVDRLHFLRVMRECEREEEMESRVEEAREAAKKKVTKKGKKNPAGLRRTSAEGEGKASEARAGLGGGDSEAGGVVRTVSAPARYTHVGDGDGGTDAPSASQESAGRSLPEAAHPATGHTATGLDNTADLMDEGKRLHSLPSTSSSGAAGGDAIQTQLNQTLAPVEVDGFEESDRSPETLGRHEEETGSAQSNEDVVHGDEHSGSQREQGASPGFGDGDSESSADPGRRAVLLFWRNKGAQADSHQGQNGNSGRPMGAGKRAP
ncbi:uncharacterized protein LOC144166032 [Haemaphysalis longicornis]